MENQTKPQLFSEEFLASLTDQEDLALGSVLGAFIGDSMGSRLEFRYSTTPEEVEEALTMPGGGPFLLAPGQVTDDSELALCLAKGISEGLGNKEVNFFDCIGKYYGLWINSRPFDKGNTIANALQPLKKKELTEGVKGWATLCREAAQHKNDKSASNGGLMRITPLAVLCSFIDDEQKVIEIVKGEQTMTHSNAEALSAAITYVLAIRHLLRNKGDINGALKIVETYIKEKASEIEGYWMEAEEDSYMPATKTMGYVKIAWSYAFKFLMTMGDEETGKLKENAFLDALKIVLSKVGDCDTNCCIVGGMIGAGIGLRRLIKESQKQVEILISFDPENAPVHPRDKIFRPSSAVDLVMEIAKFCKTQTQKEIESSFEVNL